MAGVCTVFCICDARPSATEHDVGLVCETVTDGRALCVAIPIVSARILSNTVFAGAPRGLPAGAHSLNDLFEFIDVDFYRALMNFSDLSSQHRA